MVSQISQKGLETLTRQIGGRLRNEPCYFHTTSFGAAAGNVIAIVKLLQRHELG